MFTPPSPETPADHMRILQELQGTINELPTLTAPVILEELDGDEIFGRRYELLQSRTIGKNTSDPGLVLKIRRVR